MDPSGATPQGLIETVRQGRPGTAMKGFGNILNDEEIAKVVDFIRLEFMQRKAVNTAYHTAANGWPDHRQRYAPAYPYATGELALDRPWDELDDGQRRGKRLFMQGCITCHDRARVSDEGLPWQLQAASYPRQHYSHRRPDAISGASPYAIHDVPPVLNGKDEQLRQGEQLYQANCAFCHAADGTGQNWIGAFLQPSPRNLTDPAFMQNMTKDRLRSVIRQGLPGTGMPAWKDVLDAKQIDAIIAYIDRVFHALTGSEIDLGQ